MTTKTPVRATFTGSNVTGLAEYQSGEFIPLTHGGLGASLSIGSAGQVLKVNGAGNAIEFGAVEAIVNIDNATDLESATLAVGDKILLSDGGTEGRVLLSQLDTLFSGTTKTLTNKTLTSPAINNPTITGGTFSGTFTGTMDATGMVLSGASPLVFEGATADASETTLAFVDPTTDRTITFPNATGTIVLEATGSTLTNKSIDLGNNTISGSLAEFNTALQDDSFAGLAATQTLTNKTLTSPVLNTGVSGSAILDEDDLSSNSATQLATQQSIKAYVDAISTTLTLAADSGSNDGVVVGTDTLTFAGGTGIDSTVSNNQISYAIDSTVATLTGTQTLTNKTLTSPTITGTGAIAGTFTGNITGDVTGNADTATALETARTIGGTSFDGTANIAVNLAATATTLATARNIGGVSFDGSANINLPGVNAGGNQDTSGNAATATVLETARTIAGQSFNGSANITIASTDLSDTAAITLLTASQTLTNKTLTTPVIAEIDATGDFTVDAVGGIILDAGNTTVSLKDDGTEFLKFVNNSGSALIRNTGQDKDISFVVNDGGSTITALTIDSSEAGAVSLNGALTVGGNAVVTGNLTVNGTTTTLATTNSTITDRLIELGTGTTGTPGNDMGLVFERGDSDNAFVGWDESTDKFIVGTGTFTGASTGDLTITTGTLVANLEGNVTGNVTGNVSGTSGSTTGNAATATALANARTIAGQSFDGTGNITIASTDLSNTSAITLLTASQTLTNKTLTTPVIAEIDATGDFTLDAAGDIFLDAAGNEVKIKNAGTELARFVNNSQNLQIKNPNQDKDITFQGNDGGSNVDALTLDMSAAGAATFNSTVTASGFTGPLTGNADTATTLANARTIAGVSFDGSANIAIASTDLSNTSNIALLDATQTLTNKTLTSPTITNPVITQVMSSDTIKLNAAADITIDAGGQDIILSDDDTIIGTISMGNSDLAIRSRVSDKDLLFKGSDGGSEITALTLDMSDAGAATFNSNVTVGGTLTFEGATADGHETTLTVVDPTADRTITFQNGSGTVAFLTDVTGGATPGNFTTITLDNNITFEGATDDAHETTLSVEDPTADRTVTIPDATGQIVLRDTTDTLTNKTLTSPVINSPTGDFIKIQGTDFSNSLLIGHATTGTLDAASYNVGVGIATLDAITSGDHNTALGAGSATSLTTSSNNVIIGSQSANALAGGNGQNVLIGKSAGYNNVSGAYNVFIGESSGASTSGSTNNYNVGIGRRALQNITTGEYNIALGQSSGDNITTGSGNVVIGKADVSSATGDDQLSISDGEDGSVVWLTGDSSGNLTLPGNVTTSGNATITGNLTVNGTTTTLATTNSVISDRLIELGNGTTGTPGNDMGIVLERGDSDNAFIGWDESTDKFIVGTGTFTGASTGNLTITTGTLVANLEGNVTGNVTGNVSGSSGSTTGNAATATALANARNIGGVSFDGTANINLPGVNTSGSQDTSGNAATATALETARTIAGQSFDGTGNITIASTDLSNTSAIALLTASQTLTNKTLTTPVIEEIDGSTITLDSAGDIVLDAGGADIFLKDDGTTFGVLRKDDNDNLEIQNQTTTVITFDGTKSTFAGDIAVGDDIFLHSDAAVIKFGAGQDVTLTHVHDTGLLLSGTSQLQFNDSGTYINSNADGDLDIVSDGTNNDAVKITSAGGISLDANESGSTGVINLDANYHGYVGFKDNGVTYVTFTNLNTNNLNITSAISDADMIFRGNDGGSTITALTLDMSAAGAATFNSTVTASGFVGDVTGDVTGNADTATTLATARTIAGQSFDGSANITIASTDLSNTSAITLLTATQTLTNKTLTSPVINAFSGTGNASIAGTLSLTSTSTGDVLNITTTENSSTAGPVINLKRNSGSVADADYMGQIKFTGENDADQEQVYAKITGKIQDASDGSEDGLIEFANVKAGSQTITARLRSDKLQLLNGTSLEVAGDATITGDLTVNGTTTTVATTNTTVADSLLELGNGTTGSPANDAGLVIERGDSDNAFIGFDESDDKFKVGTGSFTGSSTGNLTVTTGTLVANLEGNVTGNVTGNVSGTAGSATGNAATATALETARNIGGVSFDGSANIDLPGVNSSGNQDTSGNAATATILANARTIAGQSFNGSANIAIASTDLSDTASIATLTGSQTLTNKSIDSDNNTITNIVNADIKSSAAIAFSKLADLTASRALASDSNGDVSVTSVTATELGYLDGVSSAIQTQLDAKHATIDSSNRLNANLVGDGSVDSTEFGYLNGVTSAVQTQIDNRATKGFAIAMAIAL